MKNSLTQKVEVKISGSSERPHLSRAQIKTYLQNKDYRVLEKLDVKPGMSLKAIYNMLFKPHDLCDTKSKRHRKYRA